MVGRARRRIAERGLRREQVDDLQTTVSETRSDSLQKNKRDSETQRIGEWGSSVCRRDRLVPGREKDRGTRGPGALSNRVDHRLPWSNSAGISACDWYLGITGAGHLSRASDSSQQQEQTDHHAEVGRQNDGWSDERGFRFQGGGDRLKRHT